MRDPRYVYHEHGSNQKTEFLRKTDKLIAEILGYRTQEDYFATTGVIYLSMEVLEDGKMVYKDIPFYTTSPNDSFLLFAGIKNMRLIMDKLFDYSPLSTSDRFKLGEWRVGYECDGITYLPGSGSYYPLAEAVCRAWFAYKDIPFPDFTWKE